MGEDKTRAILKSSVQSPDLIRFKGILKTALAEDAKGPPTTEFAQVHYAKAFKISVENNLSLDRIDEAIREYETAIRLYLSAPYYWHGSLAQEYGEKADWYWERGMYEKAIPPRLKQVELQQEIYPEEINRRELALSYLRLAELYVGVAKNKKAIKTLNKAIELDSAVADFVLERRWFQILEEEDKQLQKFAAVRKSIHEQRIELRRKEQAQLYNKLREIYPAIVELVIEPTDTFKYGIAGGVIIDEDGFIIACSEVADQKELEVRVEREGEVETYKAQLVARDDELGVALLEVDADGLTPPTFTDSDKIEPRKVQGGIRSIKVEIIGLVRTPNGSIRKLPRSSGISKTFRNEEGQAISWRFFDRVSSDGIPCQVLATEQGEVFAIRIVDSEHGVPQFVPINLVRDTFKQFVSFKPAQTG